MGRRIPSGRGGGKKSDAGQSNAESRNFKEETALGRISNQEVPEGWSNLPLGSLAEIRAGGSAPQGLRWFGGTNPFVRVQHLDQEDDWVRRYDLITDEAVAKHKLRLFPKGTIVLPKSGASIRLEKRAILTTDAYLVSHLAAVNPKQDVINPDFLFFSLRLMKLAKEKAEGYPTLNLSELSQTQIVFPTLVEQKTIAAVLRTVQEVREASERIIAAIRQLKRSLLQFLFTYGPVPFNQADQVPLKETEVGEMPAGWRETTLGQVATLQRGRDLPVAQRKNGHVPIVGSNGIVGFHDDAVATGPGVTVGRSGSVGEIYFVAEDYWPLNTTLWVKDFHGNEPEFIYFLLMRVPFEKYSAGVSVPTLNRNLVHPIRIAIPGLHEQHEIASILSMVDTKLASEEARRDALANLFQSLLHHLMTGKVRVKA